MGNLGGGLSCLTSIFSPQTSSWFKTDSPPNNFIKIGDRLFIGDAINYPNDNICSTGDFFTTFEATTTNGACGYIGSFQVVVENKTGNINSGAGILTAGQSKSMNSATNGAFGIAAFGFENNTGSRTGGSTWAIYGECDKTQNNGANCYGVELDVMTSVNVSNIPDPFQQGPVIGGHIACGSGVTTPTNFHCSAALQVVANVQPFNAGINFLSGSIAGTSLFGGTFSPAMSLPPNYAIIWYSSAGVAIGGITVDNSGNMDLTATGSLKFNGTTITVP